MYSFNNDYSEGAIPEIIEELQKTNLNQTVGYGMDEVSLHAKQKIKEVLSCATCDVHFLVGGTQANTTIIASALRPYEAVIACVSGHINVHETGAIEATGHKVIVAPGVNGKLTKDDIKYVVMSHRDEHMVKPAMVYISDTTEIGSVYNKEELQALREVCDEYGLLLFIDGARLGCALTAPDNDVQFSDLCKYADVFTIGGTKNGALFGEAVVIVNECLKKDFRYMIKQHGGMLAKGRLLGLQFNCLFEQNRYLKLAKHANEMAALLSEAFVECGYALYTKSTTNQVFVALPNTIIERLKENYLFELWEEIDEYNTAMRFVTSWATPKEAVLKFIEDLKQIED